MKIDELNIDAITIPEHPDPSEIRRYIRYDCGFYGVDCVFLEDATWKHALHHCLESRTARSTNGALNIGTEFRDADFTQAARYSVLRHLAATIPDRDEAWRGITLDRCCGRHNRAGIHDLSQPGRINVSRSGRADHPPGGNLASRPSVASEHFGASVRGPFVLLASLSAPRKTPSVRRRWPIVPQQQAVL